MKKKYWNNCEQAHPEFSSTVSPIEIEFVDIFTSARMPLVYTYAVYNSNSQFDYQKDEVEKINLLVILNLDLTSTDAVNFIIKILNIWH